MIVENGNPKWRFMNYKKIMCRIIYWCNDEKKRYKYCIFILFDIVYQEYKSQYKCSYYNIWQHGLDVLFQYKNILKNWQNRHGLAFKICPFKKWQDNKYTKNIGFGK